jgi:hypothetical protein
MKYFLYAFIFLIGFSCSANDFLQRSFILNELTRRNVSITQNDDVFVSSFDIRSEKGIFLKNTGEFAFSAPAYVKSAYDGAIGYDISKFYTAKNRRISLIANKYIGNDRWLVSFGLDNGSRSEKLDISNSIFSGISKSFTLDKNTYLYFSSGKWWGGKVTERPCIDAYDRAYWCPNLTAWSDRPATNTTRAGFIDVRFQYIF